MWKIRNKPYERMDTLVWLIFLFSRTFLVNFLQFLKSHNLIIYIPILAVFIRTPKMTVIHLEFDRYP